MMYLLPVASSDSMSTERYLFCILRNNQELSPLTVELSPLTLETHFLTLRQGFFDDVRRVFPNKYDNYVNALFPFCTCPVNRAFVGPYAPAAGR